MANKEKASQILYFASIQIEEHKKKIKLISEQPTCHPVFKRFLSRLLKEMQKLGLVGVNFMLNDIEFGLDHLKCIFIIR